VEEAPVLTALLLTAWIEGAAAMSAVSQSPHVSVPLCAGLTVVTAISQQDGDYESIKTIESVTSQDLALKYSSETLENAATKKLTVRRKLRLADLASATLYMHHFNNKAATTIPGTTTLGASSTVLRSLKTSGEARFGIFESVGASAPVDRNTHPNVYDYQMVETIRRVGSAPVMLPITVNDAATKLPAIHASGVYYGDKAEFFFLDDEENPIALKYRIGRDTLDVVKINFRCAAATAVKLSRLEQSLLATGRADVYSIYFSFNSDELREESAPTIEEIAEIMSRHPEWKLAIEGHTDNVASDSYNLKLSGRRAMSVRNALVTTQGIAATRLTSAGFGESRPKDRNDTLEGRARNRRVELVRLQ
jgi:outer membrane protein OmpA-like peptidoglycan-associated protein